MRTALIIVAVLVLGWLGLMILLKGFARLLRKSTVKLVRNALAFENILFLTDNASYLGADFKGPNLPPGTSGVLAVTPGKLLFMPWFPRKPITLPAAWIRAAGPATAFKGLAYNIPFLEVRVRDIGDPDGKVAWVVHDLDRWVETVNGILTKEVRGSRTGDP